jgi:hypothetical protein
LYANGGANAGPDAITPGKNQESNYISGGFTQEESKPELRFEHIEYIFLFLEILLSSH